MALNSTDGDPAADSYFSIADADTYFTARGVGTWTGSDAAKEAAARKGTSYLDNAYRNRWKGYRTEQAQALAWPRVGSGGENRNRFGSEATFPVYGLVDLDGFEIPATEVPKQVKQAAMEAAHLVLTGVDLEATLTRGGMVKSVDKSVGSLRKAITYADGAPAVDRYQVIEGLLRGLVKSGPGSTSGTVRLVRA